MTTMTTLDTPKLEKQKTDSLLLTIDIPADYDGEYRIQYYQAGYMYSGNWHTQAISPSSMADLAVPTRSSWDADNKPVFGQRVPYQLRNLEPNKCYVVRTGMKNEKGKWLNSAKSAYMYTLAKDGEKSDLEKSLVMEQEGSACDAPGDEEKELGSPAPHNTDPKSAEAGWTPVTHPGVPTSTSAIDSVMVTSTDTLGSSGSDLDSLTDGGTGAGADAVVRATARCSSPLANAEGAETSPTDSSALSGSGAEAGVETSRNDNEELERLRKQLESHAAAQVAQETLRERELAAARVKLEAAERLQHEAAAAHGREMEAVKAQVQAEVEAAKAQQARDHDAAVEAAVAAAVSKKEAEMHATFESMLKVGEEQKRALEASSAQLAEGQLRSVQAALEEERGSARRAEDARQELVAELERVRVAVRAREAELAEAEAERETLEKEVGELKEALAQVQAQALPPPYHADSSSSGGGGGGGVSGSSTMIATPVVADADAIDTLAFKRFSSGDLALFLPVPIAENGGGGAAGGQQAETALMAFHSGCPHHYISEDSLEAVRGEDGSMPTFFVGRVLMVEDHTAGARGGLGNPYNLPVGTEYHTLIVEKYA